MASGGGSTNYGVNQANVTDYVRTADTPQFQHVLGRIAFHKGIFENLNTFPQHGDKIDFETQYAGTAILKKNRQIAPGDPNAPPNPATNEQYLVLSNGYLADMDLINIPEELRPLDIEIVKYVSVLVSVTGSFEGPDIQPSPQWITAAGTIITEQNEDTGFNTYRLLLTAQYNPPSLQPGWLPAPEPDFVSVTYRLIRSEYSEENPRNVLRKKY